MREREQKLTCTIARPLPTSPPVVAVATGDDAPGLAAVMEDDDVDGC